MTGEHAVVRSLADEQDTVRGGERGSRRLANLSGGSVAEAVGSFRYRYFSDGTVEPDPDWVSANIRTARVPLLGRVTCHRVLLSQLRAALEEIVERGLADAIDPADYGGCYVPRFIGRDPARGLSLHTWGIAVDINVSTNQRGTPGEIDRDVVAIFQRWGFAWGGHWEWTDPMHFELARLVQPR
nr:M15 family metallopeptidase [Haloechinothrix aidingensis]